MTVIARAHVYDEVTCFEIERARAPALRDERRAMDETPPQHASVHCVQNGLNVNQIRVARLYAPLMILRQSVGAPRKRAHVSGIAGAQQARGRSAKSPADKQCDGCGDREHD